MGLNINSARFLLSEMKRGLVFGDILTLGRQEAYMGDGDYNKILASLNVKRKTVTYGDEFFLGLGANSLKVMDASPYEGADVIHDLNTPIDQSLHRTFDTVIDGGTLEHVFHFPNSIKNCMEMVKEGGHLILMTPWHNYAGHGFYQFSPELFYSILSQNNGYTVERMLIVSGGQWYSVLNPSDLKQRIEISSNDPIDLYVCARRDKIKEIFEVPPQQSDYSNAWTQSTSSRVTVSRIQQLKTGLMEKSSFLRTCQAKWRQHKSRRQTCPSKNRGMVRICNADEIPS